MVEGVIQEREAILGAINLQNLLQKKEIKGLYFACNCLPEYDQEI
jgi:hypothetical protein